MFLLGGGGHSLWGRIEHKQNSPENPGQSCEHSVYVFFSCLFVSSSPSLVEHRAVSNRRFANRRVSQLNNERCWHIRECSPSKCQGQKFAQGILRLRNPNEWPILGNEIWMPEFWTRILGSNFLILFFSQQKRPPEKFTLEKVTSQNSPSKIQPRNWAITITLHLCRAILLTKCCNPPVGEALHFVGKSANRAVTSGWRAGIT